MELVEIAHLRLRNQRLSGSSLDNPAAVVGWLGAMQGQELALAKWSVGQRSVGVCEPDVSAALADGRILRTHMLRPTWHLVLPADIVWVMQLTGPRVQAGNRYWNRRFGLDERVFGESRRHIRRALADGRHLTRRELAEMLSGHGIVVSGLQLGYLLMRAELDLVICSGAPKGRQQTYALLEERAPQARPLPRDEALAELTRRYFTSRGPATLKDYTWWSSLTIGDARRGVELLAAELDHFTAGGRTYWLAAVSPLEDAVAPPAHLLQLLDEYFIGYSESRDAMDAARVGTGERLNAESYMNIAIVNGQLVAFWRRSVQGRQQLTIEIQLLGPLDRLPSQALEAAADRYRHFLNLESVELRLIPR